MSQLTGSFTIETDRLSRELALAVVAQLDRVDFIGAMADAVVRRMAGGQPAGGDQYERPADPGPGGGRHGARFGGVLNDSGDLERDENGGPA